MNLPPYYPTVKGITDYAVWQLVYPDSLLKADIAGEAVCTLRIDSLGIVRSKYIEATHPLFAKAAEDVIEGMREWQPAKKAGRDIDSTVVFHIPFNPDIYSDRIWRQQQVLESCRGQFVDSMPVFPDDIRSLVMGNMGLDLTALDNGHLGNSVAVLGSVEQILAVAAVDLADDGVDSREDLLNEALIPLLERLSHNGVVGVSEGVGNDVPSLLPAVAALVEEYSHQLRDSEGRVSIVDVDSNLLVEVLQCAVYVHVAHYDIADGSGAHEVLLAQTERLALEVVIVRVKNLGNSVSDVVSAHSLGVVAGVEAVHIEGHGLGAPQTELGNALAVVAGNVHIVGNSVYCGVVDVLEVVVVILPVLVDLTVEVYLDSLVGNRNEPSAAAGEPVIGKLGLPAVNDLLLEDTVLITDRVTGSGIVAGCETVHVAGCKSAQTAVADSVRVLHRFAGRSWLL